YFFTMEEKMKKLCLALTIFSLFFMVVAPTTAQDTFKEIERYDPETDPQVNFPQKLIDEAMAGDDSPGDTKVDDAFNQFPADGTGTDGKTDEGSPTVKPAPTGSSGAKLVKAAAEIYKKYAEPGSFPYLPETKGGKTGCAQVVNTIFEEAGMPIFGPNVKSGSEDYYNRIRVIATVEKLKSMGWQLVKPPPYQAGDVITWNTTGADNSHIGIIMATGNNVKAISNSTQYKRPRFHPAGEEYADRTLLLRKVG
ncbi:MAG: hypothetical protein AB1403_11405, partial [Candidatus Riflebacteria bacterium]